MKNIIRAIKRAYARKTGRVVIINGAPYYARGRNA